MVWCRWCIGDYPRNDDDPCFRYCSNCGLLISDNVFTDEPTFVKDSRGQTQLSGSYVNSIQNDYSRTLSKGKEEIKLIVSGLTISGGDNLINQASAYYKMALEKGFTRGRSIAQVAAACIYIACRTERKPYLLIDFSEYLKINVYVLGAVFLQLCNKLWIENNPNILAPVDPALYIELFTKRLLGKQNFKVSQTALRIIASMKRDWMQNGRKPSGLCGAALYISALSYGYKFSKSDIVRVVHICEATLTRRLIEFENTDSGSLTIEELIKNAEQMEKEFKSRELSDFSFQASGKLCIHKNDSNTPCFAHGLCRSCYFDFIKISGGVHGGSDPPAFRNAEKGNIVEACGEKVDESNFVLTPRRINNKKVEPFTKADQYVVENEKVDIMESESIRSAYEDQVTIDVASNMPEYFKDMSTAADESDNLSDIDDAEVTGYLNNSEEIHYKTIIWDEMNKEYLEEQAAKEAANAAADKNIFEATEDMRDAQKLAAAAVSKSRKERRQQRALEDKNASPAKTAAEAIHRMLTKKRLSSKINYDVLEKLFDDTPYHDAKRNGIIAKEHETDIIHKNDLGQEEEDMEESIATDNGFDGYW